MAHKTIIDGTFYEIKGGKTLVEGTSYSIKGGKTLVNGTAYEVGFSGFPDDLDTGLEFISASPFTISVSNSSSWDGTMEYTNGNGWVSWDGSEISSGDAENGQCVYIRGTGNTRLCVEVDRNNINWILSGTNIKCNGDIGKLLDYATVRAGRQPTMSDYCYTYMFRDCTALTSAPRLPATTLTKYCYCGMFYGCTSLTTAPSLPTTTLSENCYTYMFRDCTALTSAPRLPATTLAKYCYFYMFYGCTSLTTAPSLPATTLLSNCYGGMFCGCGKIKLSATQTGEYQIAYRIPTSGTGQSSSTSMNYMLEGTGGTFTSNPQVNTTYYLSSSNTVV